MDIQGRLPYSSNYTFLVTLSDESQAIYKPAEGEQPLHDFPPNLYRREVAAYTLSQELGWPAIPETVEIAAGPYGPGSLQRFVDADFEQHYFSLFENQQLHQEFVKVAVFDIVANNADRKSGHCLIDRQSQIWCIDHGLCFNEAPKLRTVIWEFGGQPVPSSLMDDLHRLAGSPLPGLAGLLSNAEVEATRLRTKALIDSPTLPQAVSQRQYPWPLL